MLEATLSEFPQHAHIKKIYLADLNFVPCCASRDCLELGYCPIQDDMQSIYKDMLWADIIIFATGSQFGDVTAGLKALIERTWPLRGKLKNKIGGYVVSARRYAESTKKYAPCFYAQAPNDFRKLRCYRLWF